MISGEIPGGIDDLHYSENTGLTLSIGMGEVISLNLGNTAVYRSNVIPEADCIEISVPADDTSEARVIRIFDRPDIMDELAMADFTVKIGRRAMTKERVQAYTEWEASDLEQEWLVLNQDGVSLSRDSNDILRIAHDSPEVELQLEDGKIFTAKFGNAQVCNYPPDSLIASCVSLSTTDLDTGVVTMMYLFGEHTIEQELDDLGFTVTRLPYPSDSVAMAYAAHCLKNLDAEVLFMRGDDEATSV